MTDPAKLAKFIKQLECMVSRLAHQHDLSVHDHISEFYYLQEVEEMKILLNLLTESQRRMETIVTLVDTRYCEVFIQWRKDVRWLSTYLRSREDFRTIL